MSSQISKYKQLLETSVNPDVATAFRYLVDLKLYEDVFCFFKRWQDQHFDKCVDGIRSVIDIFHQRIASDQPNSVQEFITFLQALQILLSETALNSIFDILFAFPMEKAFLDTVEMDQVDTYLKAKAKLKDTHPIQFPLEMNSDQIKALLLLARRRHKKKDFLLASKIYTSIACRTSDIYDPVSLRERLHYLEGSALIECLHLGSISSTKEIQHKIEFLKFQYQVLERLHNENSLTTQKLQREVLSANELFEVITTHPTLKNDLSMAEELLNVAKKVRQ